jgi:predicted DNA-binding ArsR family transcriptional regulator
MSLKQLTNKNIRKIVCVYQLQFTNCKSPGIGDFLRGCFFVLQLSKLLNLEFELDISNHPIAKYIENSGKNSLINYDNIEFIDGHNRPPHLWQDPNKHLDINYANQIIDKINNYSYSDTYAFFTNAFPIFYTFLDTGREKIKNMLIPNAFMQEYIDTTLNEMNLTHNTYATIHIRSGDQYLTNSENMNIVFINNIKKYINRLIIPGKKYLIISDSNILKIALKSYPNFYIINRKIEHLGGESLKSTESNGVMNTLLDFYLMSYSNAIIALSVYDHISGFSQYCSTINKIPFSYIILS